MLNEFPGYACILGNILETTGAALSQPDCSFEMALDLAAVTTYLLEALPPIKSSSRESSTVGEDDMIIGDESVEIVLDDNLQQQITNAIDSRFLVQLTNVLFGGISTAHGSHNEGPDDKEVAAVAAACAFLHVTFNTLPLERIMTVLAYRTELVPVLWNFMKRCHQNQKWSSLPERFSYLLGDALLCPFLSSVQALWQILWVNPSAHPSSGKFISNTSGHKKHPVEAIQSRVGTVASELLSQLQDWNNRRQFTPPSDFHADGVNDYFISQAVTEGTKAHDILKQAPFLIPFTSRVKIFTSQLASVRQRQEAHGVFTRNQFRIRRDHILEDAYNQMSALSEEDLRGLIRVTFVNEFGVEEAGIDGGGIFKDFMENITRAAFDVQYGLFKVVNLCYCYLLSSFHVARFLMKTVSQLGQGRSLLEQQLMGRAEHLMQCRCEVERAEDWLKPSVILEAFEVRAFRMSIACAKNLSKFSNPEDGFSELSPDLLEAAIAHCQLIVVSK
ncbi:hypothetical protein CXB51_022043 [Gossypium anomalum]|uniref:HECT-type E3 ubiquitin transferase n=1 Tax=Gossypium anomalum TaxID=47600 RepID=A0A8J5YQP6_9ROSI|nr:hypothetical protein CXB51_022043 [Gossypium anomalum]